MLQEIQPLRSASRQVVRELGILAPKFGPLGISHSACHLLMELEASGPMSLLELAEAVRLDKSTTSRMVASLDDEGLVQAVSDGNDKRRLSIALTSLGRERVQVLHGTANRQVEEAISFLTPEDRQKVVDGMRIYADSLRKARVFRETSVRAIGPNDDVAVAGVIREVMLSYALDRPGSALLDPEVTHMFSAYSQPGHAYFVVERNGKVAGGGGIGPLAGGDGTVCELRKMYLLRETRGYGLGQRLLERCLEAARGLGYKTCYLETLSVMTEAHRLYERNGFTQVDESMGCTGHFICDKRYVKDLTANG